MNEWGIFIVLGSVLGFFGSLASILNTYVTKPMNKNTIEIAVLNEQFKVSKDNDLKQDETLLNHEQRITSNTHEIEKITLSLTHYHKDRVN